MYYFFVDEKDKSIKPGAFVPLKKTTIRLYFLENVLGTLDGFREMVLCRGHLARAPWNDLFIEKRWYLTPQRIEDLVAKGASPEGLCDSLVFGRRAASSIPLILLCLKKGWYPRANGIFAAELLSWSLHFSLENEPIVQVLRTAFPRAIRHGLHNRCLEQYHLYSSLDLETEPLERYFKLAIEAGAEPRFIERIVEEGNLIFSEEFEAYLEQK